MRRRVKRALALLDRPTRVEGTTVLIYHRVGGGSPDERDVRTDDFAEQVEVLRAAPVISLDTATERLRAGDRTAGVVLTFDDGFRDVYENAWPLLREAGLPFTVYVATAFIGGTMHWEGSTAKDTGAPALSWDQLREMVDSGLCTVGNHTHEHVRPERLDEEQLDRCTAEVDQHLGLTPRHFAYTWGIPVPRLDEAVRLRFDTAVTGELGRVLPGDEPVRMRRVPVRGSDPLDFFRAKLSGGLAAERHYERIVRVAKHLRLPA